MQRPVDQFTRSESPLESDQALAPRVSPAPALREARPWLGVRFLCAGAYQRVFRNAEGDAYLATCPRCGRNVRFAIGREGTSQRFFDVSC
jgi:hypothetical protein